MDATHNNPVLNVFIYLLHSEIQAKAEYTLIQEGQPSGKHVILFNMFWPLSENYIYRVLLH